MKTFLMHADRDVDLERELPANEDDLVQDLELDALIGNMALGDKLVLEVAKHVVLSGLIDPDEIRYRQRVLADCLDRADVVRELYLIAVEAVEGERRSFFGLSKWSSPNAILGRSVQVMQFYVGLLRRLRKIAEEQAGGFRSEGFVRLFSMLVAELDDGYFQTVEDHLRELRFRGGVLISAGLGPGNKGVGYVLRRMRERRWTERISFGRGRHAYSFQIEERDEMGIKALGQVEGRGINLVANALAQSADHILSFFSTLRSELAFYVGCLNLHERLAAKGEPTCFPEPTPPGAPTLASEGLYDPCLSLHLDGRAVGNGVDATGKRLVMVTGANQGGKSTFLRSVGLAQLMMQAGMFVPAVRFRADVCSGVYTHHKREEDPTMESGKLDEELRRMSAIADMVTPSSLVLCNESFASTNEREGSEIARQVIRALLEANIKVVFVTHLFDLADGFHAERADDALFLRAERQPDGHRTFRLVEGAPLPTSFGEDLYRRVFGIDPPSTATG